MGIQVVCGNNIEIIKTLRDESINSVVTSPPYWGLRNYGTNGKLWGGDPNCDHEFDMLDPRRNRSEDDVKKSGKSVIQEKNIGSCYDLPKTALCKKCGGWIGELGLEPYYQLYVDHIAMVFDEIYRVLRKDGTLWLNIGDSYSQSGKNAGRNNGNARRFHENANSVSGKDVLNVHCSDKRMPAQTLPSKNLCGIPWRVAFALQDRGWILRSDIIWQKPCPIPESVKDRPTRSFEHVFFFVKNKRYFYNYEGSLQPYAAKTMERYNRNYNAVKNDNTGLMGVTNLDNFHKRAKEIFNPKGKNLRDVWKIANSGIKEKHFACVDDLTECLTYSGWKKWYEIRDSDKILSYNMNTRTTEFSELIDDKVYTYDYCGDMVACKGRYTDILMTPNHRNIVSHRVGGHDKSTVNDRIEIIRRADEISRNDKIKVSSKFCNTFVSNLSINHYALLGWFFTDGCICNKVTIYQKEGEKADIIRGLLKSEKLLYTERKRCRENKWEGFPGYKAVRYDVEFIINSDNRYFTDYCYDVNGYKKTPKLELLYAEHEKLMALYDGMINGDGSRRKICDNKSRRDRAQFIQKNRLVVEFFEILCVLLGKRCITTDRITKYKIKSGEVRRSKGSVVFVTNQEYNDLRSTNGKKTIISVEHYIGKVWCPRTKNGTFVAKRNGKIFITGNTYPYKLVETCLKAGCPEGGTVLDPFGGSGTTALVADRLNMSAISIDVNESYCDIQRDRIKKQRHDKLDEEHDKMMHADTSDVIK
jgi:DNA modification methylase